MTYSEARGESWAGKQGVAHVAKNQKAKNLVQFDGNTYEVFYYIQEHLLE